MAQRFLDATAAPIREAFLGPRGKLSVAWERWFDRMPATLNAIPSVLNLVALDTQAASIAATDFSNSTLLKGTYRVSYHARISQAASTSSSLTVAITWTEDAVVQTVTGAAMTGNTTTTRQSDVFLIRSDAGTAVNYATTYASVGATPMQYTLDIVLQVIRPRGNQ
jgi:hypothetical protein